MWYCFLLARHFKHYLHKRRSISIYKQSNIAKKKYGHWENFEWHLLLAVLDDVMDGGSVVASEAVGKTNLKF